MITIFILIGILAYVISNILMDYDMILGWLPEQLSKLPSWLGKPLGLCEYCLGGQLALWFYLVEYWDEYNFVAHILMIGLTIFTVHIINTWTINKNR